MRHSDRSVRRKRAHERRGERKEYPLVAGASPNQRMALTGIARNINPAEIAVRAVIVLCDLSCGLIEEGG